MASSKRIISTKVLPNELVQKLEQAGIELFHRDFISIRFTDNLNKTTNQIVMISSKNALYEGINFEGKSVYCVGSKTAKAIEAYGGNVAGIFENSKAMAKEVSSLEKPATFVCGSRRMPEVENAFKATDLEIIEAYNTILTPSEIKGDFEAALFYSPSGVESFFSSNSYTGNAICIGQTTEKEALKHGVITQISKESTIESVVETTIEALK
ncbi:MAG: hypothetical protein CL850_02575 [Crocinitomicaceae bacterium]|nr:hypothetical protein [Crocinitomicaceae bacterium]|tara:strand:- start:758 stop:1390 length:633 start_codon:yes stop_codon:yes gene_type:complete